MATFHLVDAFTDTAFTGNPAGVVMLDHGPVDATFASRVAAEVGASETAFVHPEAGAWRLRWWTPAVEVDLCGHATLATAHVLTTAGASPSSTMHFRTRSGTLTATRGDDDRLWLDLPAWPVASRSTPTDRDPDLTRLLGGIAGRYLGRTTVAQANDVIEVADVAALDAITPDLEAVRALGAGGLIVTAPGAETDAAMRYFAPALGVDEDPVTGSAACTVAPLWAARLGEREITIEQRSHRGGRLWTRVDDDRVAVGGYAVTTIRGEVAVAAGSVAGHP
ncbi:MAG: PhzF family phenazine biosynthesis protein [Nitriliruptoraceae bacterium]